ncbi:McrB family protein [Rothia nasimurium]|uniref:McrB family protein n=1 Tax=Rothia nasimurium TaxID=85336 RepID=UPI003B9E4991
MVYGNYEAVEALAQQFKDISLIGQQSILTGEHIWIPQYFDELYNAYVLSLDETRRSFESKINIQLSGVTSQARQLFAEIYILDMLPLGNIGQERKLKNINSVLAGCDPAVGLTREITTTLRAGVFNGGHGYNNYRWGHFVFAIQFGQAFSRLSLEERQRRLSTPDEIENTIYSLVDDVEGKGYAGFQKALCYLLAPQFFEPIISTDHLRKITTHFVGQLKDDEQDLSWQRQAALIRQRIAEERHSEDWHFYLDSEEWAGEASSDTSDQQVSATDTTDMSGEAIEPAPELMLPDETANNLNVSQQWLDRFITVLGQRHQVILQGPPGTGKTYLARRLARILAGAENRVKLVQFHPAYTYEDFFEGFRPVLDHVSGTTSLQLRQGPLRQLAEAAAEQPDQNFFLIIDEINRGNLARIFGELYFLLEYRDHAVDLMYSQDQFSLPANLYIIGTMNTADRSIALVDSAMRRRFAFFNLHPEQEPTANVLELWARKQNLSGVVLDAWKELNRRIPNPDLKVGPSYFMRKEAFTEEGLKLIWDSEILPLLDEYFYGQTGTRERFALNTILSELAQ